MQFSFLHLQWLEAGIFFLFLYADDQRECWAQLASSRLQCYEKSMIFFDENKEKYISSMAI